MDERSWRVGCVEPSHPLPAPVGAPQVVTRIEPSATATLPSKPLPAADKHHRGSQKGNPFTSAQSLPLQQLTMEILYYLILTVQLHFDLYSECILYQQIFCF